MRYGILDRPLLNTPLAKQVINLMGLYDVIPVGQKVESDAFLSILFDSNITYRIEQFMKFHPRGRHTAGDERLRNIYTACYTIKRYQSMTPNFRKQFHESVTTEHFTKVQMDYLLALPSNGDMVTELVGERRATHSLYELGLVNGFVDGRGAFREHWLTDLGLHVQKTVKQYGAVT